MVNTYTSGAVKLAACMALALAVVLLAGAPGAEAQVTCTQVANDLTPCASFVISGGSIPTTCCNGIKTLYGTARTTPDRQQVCKCLKQAMSSVPYGFNFGNAMSLPARCGVNLPYKIDPSIDCNQVR